MLKEVLKIMFGMIFTQNYVLVQFIAICPFLGVSKKFDSCIGMSGAVIFVMTLASAATHLIYQYIMVPNGLEYLSTIIFILVIAALVQFVEIFLKKYIPPLYKSLGVYLPPDYHQLRGARRDTAERQRGLHCGFRRSAPELRQRLLCRRRLRSCADPLLRCP